MVYKPKNVCIFPTIIYFTMHVNIGIRTVPVGSTLVAPGSTFARRQTLENITIAVEEPYDDGTPLTVSLTSEKAEQNLHPSHSPASEPSLTVHAGADNIPVGWSDSELMDLASPVVDNSAFFDLETRIGSLQGLYGSEWPVFPPPPMAVLSLPKVPSGFADLTDLDEYLVNSDDPSENAEVWTAPEVDEHPPSPTPARTCE